MKPITTLKTEAIMKNKPIVTYAYLYTQQYDFSCNSIENAYIESIFIAEALNSYAAQIGLENLINIQNKKIDSQVLKYDLQNIIVDNLISIKKAIKQLTLKANNMQEKMKAKNFKSMINKKEKTKKKEGSL